MKHVKLSDLSLEAITDAVKTVIDGYTLLDLKLVVDVNPKNDVIWVEHGSFIATIEPSWDSPQGYQIMIRTDGIVYTSLSELSGHINYMYLMLEVLSALVALVKEGSD
jgi:hypothetical protein